ncbi:MAG: hypothetical protein JOZ52_05915 [Acidobacteria bacterium]|nr:hypothetical protein [Acidobacteriota bacterium]
MPERFSQFAPLLPRPARLCVAACWVALAFGGLFFLDGCSRRPKTTAQQQQSAQTRPRVAGNENDNRMTNEPKTGAQAPFYAALEKSLARRGLKSDAVCDPNDAVARRILEDYGAMFLASQSVLPPPVCIFKSEDEVKSFQQRAGVAAAEIEGDTIELQPAAMKALLEAREEAQAEGLDITPRGGTEAARRNYEDTRRLWDTRFLPALKYWQEQGKLSEQDVARLKALPLHEQVREVLELEKRGIYFSQDLSKSILYSIAAPGSSQHIAMLALDVTEFQDPRVRQILARHGWFQTVKSDLPHFTYLGVEEDELPSLGLRAVTADEQVFWIPNVETQG